MTFPRRRWLLGSAVAIAAPWIAHAQPQRIGWITSIPFDTWHLRGAFVEAMRERGWIEGTHYALDTLHYDGHAERIPALAAELVQRRPDVIVASGSPTVAPLIKATSTIPIVMLAVGDPVGSGFVTNLARPGGNVTSLGGLGLGLVAKQLDLLKQAVPRAQRIGVALNLDFGFHAPALQVLQTGAQGLGVQLRTVALRSPEELGPAFAALTRERIDAMLLLGQPFLRGASGSVAALTLEHRLPAVGNLDELVQAGVLMTYSERLEDYVRRLPYYIDHILKGAARGELPVERPTRFYLTVNLKTARALGLTLPQALLFQATEVIE